MIKKLSLLSFCLLLFVGAFSQKLSAQEASSAYAYICEYTFGEDNVDKAIELLSDYQTQTLDADEGCLVLDILWSEENASQLFVYVHFESEEQYNKHLQSPYYKSLILQQLKPLITSQKITKVIPLNQDDDIYEEDI